MSRRRLVLPRERRKKATTTQQLGLESSDVSYIVVLGEIERGLEVFAGAFHIFNEHNCDKWRRSKGLQLLRAIAHYQGGGMRQVDGYLVFAAQNLGTYQRANANIRLVVRCGK